MRSHIFREDNSELQSVFLALLTQAELPDPDNLSGLQADHISFKTLGSLIAEYVVCHDLSTEESDILDVWQHRYLDLFS